jgi:hypothetical protein
MERVFFRFCVFWNITGRSFPLLGDFPEIVRAKVGCESSVFVVSGHHFSDRFEVSDFIMANCLIDSSKSICSRFSLLPMSLRSQGLTFRLSNCRELNWMDWEIRFTGARVWAVHHRGYRYLALNSDSRIFLKIVNRLIQTRRRPQAFGFNHPIDWKIFRQAYFQ